MNQPVLQAVRAPQVVADSCANCAHGKRISPQDLECWAHPPVSILVGVDPRGMPQILSAVPRPVPGYKCGEWKKRLIIEAGSA